MPFLLCWESLFETYAYALGKQRIYFVIYAICDGLLLVQNSANWAENVISIVILIAMMSFSFCSHNIFIYNCPDISKRSHWLHCWDTSERIISCQCFPGTYKNVALFCALCIACSECEEGYFINAGRIKVQRIPQKVRNTHN